ncbi:phosphate ABC transporter ATP-binding protein [Oleidesulfovibrio sp.]|uniref:ABC transporter ATP-binding protein n=1 Tax=Oleidesulfovibrio sp. TaxID=2909707 RepID=UPI003A84ED0F
MNIADIYPPTGTSDISPDAAVTISGLSLSFGKHQTLHNVTLAVPRQGATVIVGRSGSGKTTLLRAINRLNECMAECTTTGSIRLNLSGKNVDVYSLPARDVPILRAAIGMVFQTPDVLPVSIRKNMELPLKHVLNMPSSAIFKRMQQALQDAGLWREVSERLDAPAESLSGGQQQRLCIARSLAMLPELLLLDEPTASLDTVASRTIEELITSLKRRLPVVMVSHSLGQALRLADTLVLMNEGCITRVWKKESGLPEIADLENYLENASCCI